MLAKRSGSRIECCATTSSSELVLSGEFQPLFESISYKTRAPWRTSLKAYLSVPSIIGASANSIVEFIVAVNESAIGSVVSVKVGNAAMPVSQVMSVLAPININAHQVVSMNLMARVSSGSATISGDINRKIMLESIEH